MGKFAVHNYHTPAIAINDDGSLTDASRSAALPEPLFVAETMEAAEQWRKDNAPKHYEARNTETVGSDRNR